MSKNQHDGGVKVRLGPVARDDGRGVEVGSGQPVPRDDGKGVKVGPGLVARDDGGVNQDEGNQKLSQEVLKISFSFF